MNTPNIQQYRNNRGRSASGSFTEFLGEAFYRISDIDCLPPFFMTIVSSSDVWNYIWSNGALTAGRVDSDHAIFPYYTADKILDGKACTGPFTSIIVRTGEEAAVWEPLGETQKGMWNIERNLYKDVLGTQVWFEEINRDLALAFQYSWTSSERFGLVRRCRLVNLSDRERKVSVLDGARNILPACVTSSFQNDNSVLLDAYKRSDLDGKAGLAYFSVTSIVTDKAEPSEGLLANVSWFSVPPSYSTLDLDPEAPAHFRTGESLCRRTVLKGGRAAFYLHQSLTLSPGGEQEAVSEWYQVFDTALDASSCTALADCISDRTRARTLLEKDIGEGRAKLAAYIAKADGAQDTGEKETCAHHAANVLFNIMRGGLPACDYEIDTEDFLAAVSVRNRAAGDAARALVTNLGTRTLHTDLEEAVRKSGNPQLERLYLEYLPLTFSRRHGDPSRPWNRFSIELKDKKGNPRLNYQGNWRDIFQNWEALGLSWPRYYPNMTEKFLSACTVDGFNPYRVTREGIDWEVLEPDNPWSNIGYWGDHQIIYLEKLLEWQRRFDRNAVLEGLDRKLYATSNVPYRLVPYSAMLTDPRSTIRFDEKLHRLLLKEAESYGTDAKLLRSRGGEVILVSMTEKFLSLILAKLASLVPGGGIWLNTQRPEWNDANNALAGWGLSVVTLCYLRRFLAFLSSLYAESPLTSFTVGSATAGFLKDLATHYRTAGSEERSTPASRRAFLDRSGLLFETWRETLYRDGREEAETAIPKEELQNALTAFRAQVEASIRSSRRPDGLYAAYNTMSLASDGGVEIHPLYEMLEGQVAVLSSGLLSGEEALGLIHSLSSSSLWREDQKSYILYPERELPAFMEKNAVPAQRIQAIPLLREMAERRDARLVSVDRNGIGHFNPSFRNQRFLAAALKSLSEEGIAQKESIEAGAEDVVALYEEIFHHQSFTGRSGTFYAYEGLGSIYWHMVSKLLLAVQENWDAAGVPAVKAELARCYYEIRSGLSFNKTPGEYGAFPTDPYSHTPAGSGAKQPGMTGQVKEEILTRFRELGLTVEEGIVTLSPGLLRSGEFLADGSLSFTWWSVPFTYRTQRAEPGRTGFSVRKMAVIFKDGHREEKDGGRLSREESRTLFQRTGEIARIEATLE